MYTGEKLDLADGVEALMRLHVQAAVPRLPLVLSSRQPLIDRLMAKDPAQPFQNADEVVTFLMQ